jgi:predicted Zn-dependent peptidase
MPDVRSVSMGFWVGTGSRDESPEVAGASHFLEHLLFKGTDTRSARDIAEVIDAVGGDINAFTTKEYTAFYVRVLADSLDIGLDILSDIMWAPAFRPEEIESERQVILEEILMHADEPADLVHEVFLDALYPGHPLGRDVLGDEATISAMSRDDVAVFHRVSAAGEVVPPRSVPSRPRRLVRWPSSAGRPNRPIWSSVLAAWIVTTMTATPSR